VTASSAPSGKRLRVAVTGASGFVGTALVAALSARGHAVVALSRSASRAASAYGVTWANYDPLNATSVATAIADADAVVHLAGHNVFEGRWNAKNKELIRASREDTTKAIVLAMASMPAARRPSVFVCGSAVGWYGPLAPERTVDETAPAGHDFLAQVCTLWEAAAHGAEALGVRTVITRLGVVFARDGGPLEKMALPFKLFVGGPVGNGKQVISWVHRDDVVGILVAAIEDARWHGPVNVTAPFASSSKDVAKALGHALHRPSFFPTPAFALRVALGGVSGLVTTGQRALPTVAQRNGYVFRYPTLADAMADLFRA
jgi:uncharacterized protein